MVLIFPVLGFWSLIIVNAVPCTIVENWIVQHKQVAVPCQMHYFWSLIQKVCAKIGNWPLVLQKDSTKTIAWSVRHDLERSRKPGNAKQGACVKACLIPMKASVCSSVQWNNFFLLVRSGSGVASLEYPCTKFLKKLASSNTVKSGCLWLVWANIGPLLTWQGSTLRPSAPTMWPKKGVLTW